MCLSRSKQGLQEIRVHDDLQHSLSSVDGKGTFRSDQCCKESITRKQEKAQGKPTKTGPGFVYFVCELLV